jgi:hypothetical protein
MDFEELLRKLQEQVAFWQKDNPTNSPLINSAKDTIRDVGRITDDYVAGGMGQAALRGPDALTRQLLLNAALTAAGVGAGYGLNKAGQKLAPKIGALAEWVRPRDVGIHLSPYNDLPEILPNVNVNTGAGPIPDFPLVQNKTYKFSGLDLNGKRVSPDALVDSAERYIQNIPIRDYNETLRSLYVTKSRLGKLDPETQVLGQMIQQGHPMSPSWYVPKNGRITTNQEVLKSVKFAPENWAEAVNSLPGDTPILNQLNKLPESTKQQLVDFIKKQQSLEKAKSVGRSALVGGSAVGTALTPLVAGRPALGFNNRK